MKTDGKLYFEGIEDNFASEMALEIDEAEENVAVTVNFLIAKGILLSVSPSEYELTTCPEMVGSETDSARRMRLLRNSKTSQCDALPSQYAYVCENVQKCAPIREDIDIDKKEEVERKADKPPTRHKYGSYKNVLFTDEEYAKLQAEYPTDYSKRIERLSEYIASTGKSYKSHLATIRSWARKDGVSGGTMPSYGGKENWSL